MSNTLIFFWSSVSIYFTDLSLSHLASLDSSLILSPFVYVLSCLYSVSMKLWHDWVGWSGRSHFEWRASLSFRVPRKDGLSELITFIGASCSSLNKFNYLENNLLHGVPVVRWISLSILIGSFNSYLNKVSLLKVSGSWLVDFFCWIFACLNMHHISCLSMVVHSLEGTSIYLCQCAL